MCVCMLSRFSCVQLFASLWTVACQAPLSLGFSRQEYWSGLPFHLPGDLPDPGIELSSLMSSALVPPGKPTHVYMYFFLMERKLGTGEKKEVREKPEAGDR